jgi:hypothetical protein
MQKLDFTENLKQLSVTLKSSEIIDFIDKLPSGPAINTNSLTLIIIESKSNYDKIASEDKKTEILKTLNSENIYAESNIGELLNSLVGLTLQNQQKVQLFLKPNVLFFYSFHFSLLNALKLSENVLFKDNLANIINEDTVIFRILSDDEMEISRYAKILNLLNDLIDVIQKVNADSEIEPTITLLDSGSDTNLGIKTTVETAKSLFQIFKEVWDWVLNRKFYNSKLRNAGLLDNLNVLVAIKGALDGGAIDQNTAKIYRETVIRRTEDLLELNVIPKALINTNTQESTRKLLTEYSEVKLLENRNKGHES